MSLARNNGSFQVIVVFIFMVAAVAGVLTFAGVIKLGGGGDGNTGSGSVVLWGTAKASLVEPLIVGFNRANGNFTVKYEEKSADTFDNDLLEALAAGKGPDIFLISNELLFKYSDKIFTVPYQSYPLSVFKQNFLSAGDVFLSSKGILAFPLAVDPLMTYYNQNLLEAAGRAYPPATWEEIAETVPLFLERNEKGFLSRAPVAMGQFTNVLNAKDILSALFLQTGNSLVAENNLGANVSRLNEKGGQYDLSPVLRFYTDFADPSKDVYSWNKSMPDSRDAFGSGALAFYFGFASELSEIINKNPNLNFHVASFPQAESAPFKLTLARVSGIAISSASKNFNTAFTAANLLTSGNSSFARDFSVALGVAPARREFLKAPSDNPFLPAFYASALLARSWLDPSPKETEKIFQSMVERVLSGSATPSQAIEDADARFRLLLIKNSSR